MINSGTNNIGPKTLQPLSYVARTIFKQRPGTDNPHADTDQAGTIETMDKQHLGRTPKCQRQTM